MKLFMSDSSRFESAKERPSTTKIKKFLDKTKNGELLTTDQLTVAVKVGHTTVKSTPTSFFEGYFAIHRWKKYWGNKKTIAYFKKEIS